MSAAIFALVGALLGVLGTLATEMTHAHREDRRARRDILRLTCADFSAAIIRMRNFVYQLLTEKHTVEIRRQLIQAGDDARIHYEQLRLVAESKAIQEAGRYTLRYAYGLWRQAEGREPRPDEINREPLELLEDWMQRLYEEVRKELGLAHPTEFFREPREWLHLPTNGPGSSESSS